MGSPSAIRRVLTYHETLVTTTTSGFPAEATACWSRKSLRQNSIAMKTHITCIHKTLPLGCAIGACSEAKLRTACSIGQDN
jgi:hypothetical protein